MSVSACLNRGGRRRRFWFALVAAGVLGSLSLMAVPARAAFPGQNGTIAFQRGIPCPHPFGFSVNNPEIFTVSPDGTGERRPTNQTCPTGFDFAPTDEAPTYSPDGTKIAFVRADGDNNNLFVMNADGTGVRQLTFHPADDIDPAFSPDGKQLVFVSTRVGNRFEIWTMSVEGSDPTRLTDTASNEFGPVYSPDGKKIAFQADLTGRFDNFEIYTMNADSIAMSRS